MNTRMTSFYMTVAKECARLSRARRLQVGCVVVKNNNIISFSWNGMPTGWDNNCETEEWYDGDFVLKTRPEVLHAESNAISKLARSTESAEGAELYVTHSPCIECAKLIYQAGISRVYFGSQYRNDHGVLFLKQSNIEIIQTGV
jgi:dCMP deaminase